MVRIREGEIMKEGTERYLARDAQRMNILAGRIVAETVKTTLGPKGMDKMLVDSMGDVVITNDGHVILKEMDIAHPAAKMVVEVAKTQEDEVGDGTTTAAVLTGEFLKKAEELLDQKIHASVIAKGFRMASEEAIRILNEIGKEQYDDDTIKQVVTTTLTGKGAESGKEHLAELALEAVKTVAVNHQVDLDDIKMEKKEGGSLEDSEMIRGIVIDKEVLHSGMPKKVKNARIALINTALEVEKTETSAEIRITSPEQLQAFMDEEDKMLKKMVEAIKESGANVVFCQKGIDDLVAHYLAKEGILAARRLKKSDMEKLSKAAGGRIVTNIHELSEKDLGFAGQVEERKIAKDEMIFVEGCTNPKSVTLFLRAGTSHVAEDLERSMHDAVSVATAVYQYKKVVPGGGAVEAELSKRLQEFVGSVSGREQLAVRAFAEALEVIPRTLAENAGFDPIDILVKLREKHAKDGAAFGLDVTTGNVVDMGKAGILEPLRVIEQAVKSASEAAVMILRIDDIIAATELRRPPMPEGGPPGGMGGMGGMGMPPM